MSSLFLRDGVVRSGTGGADDAGKGRIVWDMGWTKGKGRGLVRGVVVLSNNTDQIETLSMQRINPSPFIKHSIEKQVYLQKIEQK